jgi:HSP20 family protein
MKNRLIIFKVRNAWLNNNTALLVLNYLKKLQTSAIATCCILNRNIPADQIIGGNQMTLVKFNEGKNRNNLVGPVFNDIFESIMNDTFLSDRMVSRVPAVNISETDGHYHIELAAPGLKKEDFKVNLDRDVLIISAEHRDEQIENDKKYNKREYSYASFVRSFTLPDSADDEAIEAKYTDGVLNINVAKRPEAMRESRQIEIR